VKRTFIIGDVHGCLAELQELLTVASIGVHDDVVFVGDLVARGPDTLGVLELAEAIGAKSVQGNHERKLLQAYESESRGGERVKLPAGHRRLMVELKRRHWEYIRSMPMVLELPRHEVCVVHAGLVPGLPLEQQDPWVLTHIRSLDERGQPSTELGSASWAAAYRGPPHVVFGHSAQVGIQLHEHATGLDSGCVYGGRLTGLLIDEGQHVAEPRQRTLISVRAARRYFEPRVSAQGTKDNTDG
jgi:diadenosine tetraphosphatase ApaH/serine/threonine PP2A family protein phosphatase